MPDALPNSQEELDAEMKILHEELDVVDVISFYIPLCRVGTFTWQGECPICGSQEFFVDSDEQKWRCVRCHPVGWCLSGFFASLDPEDSFGLYGLRKHANSFFDL